MARMLDAMKLEELHRVFGQGFEKGFEMSFLLEWKGVNILVFMHDLDVYILISHDYQIREMIVRSEKEILESIRDEFGREIRSLTLMQTYLH